MANKIDEIRKRLKDATPGPWEYVPADDCDDWQLYNGEFTFIKQDDSGVPVSTEDGEFIANAPTDIDFLLGEVSRLKAELERAKRDNATLNLANHLPPRPRCHDCGIESLYGSVHTDECIKTSELREELDRAKDEKEKLRAILSELIEMYDIGFPMGDSKVYFNKARAVLGEKK